MDSILICGVGTTTLGEVGRLTLIVLAGEREWVYRCGKLPQCHRYTARAKRHATTSPPYPRSAIQPPLPTRAMHAPQRARRPATDLKPAALGGDQHCLCTIDGAELAVDVVEVGADGARGERQLVGDLLVDLALG